MKAETAQPQRAILTKSIRYEISLTTESYAIGVLA